MNIRSNNSIEAAKVQLRAEIRVRLQATLGTERAKASDNLCKLLIQQQFWMEAKAVLGYAPLPDELDIWPALLSALTQKVVALPAHDPATDLYVARIIKNPASDLVTGNFGIREPSQACEKIPLNQLDLALVPGLGYSESGVRLGRGRGYYDRLLAGLPGLKCGIGYDWQIRLPIPGDKHDVRLNCLLTPTRWHWVPRTVLE